MAERARSLVGTAFMVAIIVLIAAVVVVLATHKPGRNFESLTATPNAQQPCGITTTAPTWQHVVVIVMENHGYSSIIGSSSAPYINGLAAKCGLATNYHGTTHPSLPNYLAMTSGSTWGVTNDAAPSSHIINQDSIFHQLGTDQLSLQESMPTTCALTTTSPYAVKHNPAAYYTFSNSRTLCNTQDIFLAATPDVSKSFTFITPNLCNDMHSCAVSVGDKWLANFVPTILNSPTYAAGNTAVFVTWDEDSGTASNQVATLVVSPSTVAGTKSGALFNHYSLLRTQEEMLGLPLLAGAQSASSMRGAFNLISSGSPSPTPTLSVTPTPTPTATITPTPTPTASATPTPTPTDTPTPPDTATSGSPNQPSPFAYNVSNAPANPNSDTWLTKARNAGHSTVDFTTSPSWVFPIYRTQTTDPMYSIPVGGTTYGIRIPKGATPMGGSDGAMITYQPNGDAYALFQASYNSTYDTWSATGVSRTKAASAWCNKALQCGDPFNFGHRGVPPEIMASENNDLANGHIDHALELYWYDTAGSHVFPMSGNESHVGDIPEGTFLRLKTDSATQSLVNGLSSKAQVIAKALQHYGAVIGDTSGSGNRLKLQRNFTGLSGSSLSSIPLVSSHWEFVDIPPNCC